MSQISITIKDLYRAFLKPNIERRELWRVRRKGNTVTIVLWNDYYDTFEEYVLEPQ